MSVRAGAFVVAFGLAVLAASMLGVEREQQFVATAARLSDAAGGGGGLYLRVDGRWRWVQRRAFWMPGCP